MADPKATKSGIDAWADLNDEGPGDRTVAPYTPLILSAAGALGVAPFAVMRWLNAEFALAILDSIIVIAFVCLGSYIYRTRRVQVASLLIAVLCVGGTLLTIQVMGPQQVYWAYPALMALSLIHI